MNINVRFFTGFLSGLLMMSYSLCSAQTVFVQDGHSSYQIVVPADASSVEQRAANQLKDFINRSSKTILPIISENQATGNHFIYVGSTKAAQKLQVTKKVQNDGFAIFIRNNNIYIAGKEDYGTLYGANAFLEKFLGIDYLTATVIDIPAQSKISLPVSLTLTDNPAFITRDNFSDMGFNSKWNGNEREYSGGYRDWHRINHVFLTWDKESNWGTFSHNFFQLVPPQTYLSSHPDYFSLVNGKRQAQQLNLSNDNVVKIVIESLRKKIAANPDKKYWMVGQEDAGKFCQCEDCKKAYQKYGNTVSGLLVEFINKVAAAFPDKQIATFAYHETEAPPQNIKPASNVIIVSTPISAHRNTPLNSKENSVQSNYIKGWSAICNNLMIWDYYANYADILSPYPNLPIFSPNFRFYQSVHAKHIFAQRPVFMPGSEMEELKDYVISKLLWNPQLNQDSLVNSFTTRYYGAAGVYIVQYLNTMAKNLKATHEMLFTQEDAIKYRNSFLKPVYYKQYIDILDKASAAVKNNPGLQNRVNDIRLATDFYSMKVKKQAGADFYASVGNATLQQIQQRLKSTVQRLNVRFTADASRNSIEPILNASLIDAFSSKGTIASAALISGLGTSYVSRKNGKKKKRAAA